MQGLKPLLHAPWVHDDARESVAPYRLATYAADFPGGVEGAPLA